MGDLKTTPLNDVHVALGARMVPFAGFSMPVLYSGIIEEHKAVRENVGIFDVGHMGEFMVTGPRAIEVVNEIATNDVARLVPGALLYSVMCREDGTVVDDLLVFLMDPERIMLVVNASNIEKDLAHVKAFEVEGAKIENVSDDWALLAVQGPRSREVLQATDLLGDLTDRLDELPYYNGFEHETPGGRIVVSRTGYTGELGYEVFVPPAMAVATWQDIMSAGEPYGLRAVGLGARDTLRFEASYCLYGHELDDDTSPLEAGLGWVVKLKKSSFRGIETLRRQKAEGPPRALIGLEVKGRAIARQGYEVVANGEVVGTVTSGAFAPSLEKSLCMALVDRSAREGASGFEVVVRGKNVPAELTAMPFYNSRVK
jgi:aminomethyltransferase